MAIKHAILYGKKGDRVYEYYYFVDRYYEGEPLVLIKGVKNLWVAQYVETDGSWRHSRSIYRTIESAIKDPNDKKQVLIKWEEPDDN